MNNQSKAEELSAYLRSANLAEDSVFSAVCRRVLHDLRLTPDELGEALSVSRPTVLRWANGLTSPHVAMREPLRRFAQRVLTHA